MNTRSLIAISVLYGLYLGLATPAVAAQAKCPADSVRVGTVCVDKYEASVWDLTLVPANQKAALVRKLIAGTANAAALLAAGAVQRGVVGAETYLCDANGNDCDEIYAASIAGVLPSRSITWFQAQQAAANSGKRLLTNAEWQMAAAGTPDPGVSAAGSLDCNTLNGGGAGVSTPVASGSRANCLSRFGVFDMVGNFWEWVADWMPLSTACTTALFADDINCLAGASTVAGPGALIRGGGFDDGAGAGVFAIHGFNAPSDFDGDIGFRATR